MKLRLPTISPAVRIGFGLAMFTVSVLLVADLFGIIPKKNEMLLESRQKVSESLAVQLSVAVTTKNSYIVDFTLENFVERNDDVLAAAITKKSGLVVSKYGEFSDLEYQNPDVELSKDELVFVPIYAGRNRWGTVNIEYIDKYKSGAFWIITETVVGTMLFVFISCYIGYVFILRKALNVLDPKAVVPERVRSAFNTLSEGVLILDNNEKIIMANDAFTEQIEQDAEQLVGVKASSLKWKIIKEDEDKNLPWIQSIEDGIKRIGVALNLSTPHNGVRAISTNSAPILDDKGNARGALVTFDDVTSVEESNILLENAVTSLQENDDEIRRQNMELEVLASRDPLTGCYNRRAFFELFEDLFRQALNMNMDLCCIMMDIDHFKSINDRFGHAVGDEALRMIAEVLNACDHKGSVIGRYGGEEFCVVLPNMDLSEGKKVAEVFRKQIKGTAHDFGGSQVVITASFGVSSIDTAEEDYSRVLEQADESLYTAKDTGRDRVVTWVEHQDLKDSNISVSIDDVSIVDETNHKGSDIQTKLLNDRILELESELEGKTSVSAQNQFKDTITGLPTRVIFEDRVSQSMAYSARADNVMCVAILNIDMYSRINNVLGQVIGDQFLSAVGHRLKSIIRTTDTVASITSPSQPGPSLSRLHDDEFTLLLTGIDSIDSLTYVVKRIQNNFSGTIKVADKEIFVTTSIGLALYPDDGATPATLIENARSAQKQARGLVGKNNYKFYSQETNEKVVNQMNLELDMHKALENNEFYMLYQPKLDLKTGEIDSMEALIRWKHNEKGIIAPMDFIPEAERSGLIVDIGKFCLRTVCKQTKIWVDQGAEDLRVSVNVSAIEFAEDDFVETVSSILKEADLGASHLELELTETAVMVDMKKSIRFVDDLRYMGVVVTIDDFGTGYSSFSYLGHMNFDWIKIDRSFLLEAMKNERSSILYSGIVTMAKAIELKVVSEGIEEDDEYSYVKELGVDEMQGFILSKPIDAEAMTRTLLHKETLIKKVG